MAVEVTIHPEVLQWALDRSELSTQEIEKQFPKIKDWKSGTRKPTLPQARKLAKAAHLPLGRLLLSVPTPEELTIPDFRTIHNKKVGVVGADLREIIQTAELRLSWYAEYASQVGIEPPTLLGMVSSTVSPEQAAKIICKEFGWDASGYPKGQDKFAELVSRMEECGLLVMRNSIVGNNTARPLDVHEFRGFTLRDHAYALVFLSTSDSKTAQLFSLAHELGHVVQAAPGLSGDQGNENAVEQWCNRFAAALLMPEELIRKHLIQSDQLEHQLDEIARQFGVSPEALLWRLTDLKLVHKADALRIVENMRGAEAVQRKKSEGAPSFPVLVRARVGRRFLHAVAEAAHSGEFSELTAARYLGIRKRETFHKVMDLVNKGE